MTKKDYIAIAEILKQARQSSVGYCNLTAEEVLIDIIDEITGYFITDNPAFDVDKFNIAVYGKFA